MKEAGEDIEVTALREVQEETGVDQIQLRRLICVTDHCYLRAGLWHLKHTWWYDMLYTDPTNLTPPAGRRHHQGRLGREIQSPALPQEHLPFNPGGIPRGADLESETFFRRETYIKSIASDSTRP